MLPILSSYFVAAFAQDLCQQASTKWSVTKVAVAHKTGLCPVGETSVVIAVSSTHRQDALQVPISSQFACILLRFNFVCTACEFVSRPCFNPVLFGFRPNILPVCLAAIA